MKTLARSIATVFLILFAISSSYAQKLEIGMMKDKVEKMYPKFARDFREHSTAVRIQKFPLHGMTGQADFMFDNGKLLVFTWEHPKDHKEGLTRDDLKKYNALLHGLQGDYGKGIVKPSPYNKKVTESTWRLTNARGSLRYDKEKIRVQLIDADYMQRTKAKMK